MSRSVHARRRWLALGVALPLTAAGLTACTTSPAGDTDSITVAVSSSPSASGLQAQADAFTEKTGIAVEFVELPYDQIASKVLLSAKQPTAGYDVVQFDSPMMAALVSGGALAGLDDYIAGSTSYDGDDFPEQVQEYAKFDGTTYGLPLSTEPYVLWYRTDLLEAVGAEPPATWDEYQNVAEALQAAGYQGSALGYGSEIGAYYWLETLYSYGAEPFDLAECTADFTSATPRAASEIYLDLVPQTPATAVNGGGNEMTTAFVQDEVGLMVNATGYYSIINDPAQSNAVDKFAMALAPGGPDDQKTLLFGWLIGVTAKSGNPDGAWQFLEYTLGPDGVRTMIEEGAPPPARTSLVDDPAIVEQLPYLPTLLEAAAVGDHLPYFADMPRVISTLSETLNQMAVGGLSLDDGLKQSEDAVTEILADSGLCG